MALLFTLSVILIVLLFILPFLRDLKKDEEDLKIPLEIKFAATIAYINKALLDSTGTTNHPGKDARALNLFSNIYANKIIRFNYSTGNLNINLGYKFFNKEMNFEKVYRQVRNVSIFDQQRIANDFIYYAKEEMLKHEQEVCSLNNFNTVPDELANLSVSDEADSTNILTSMDDGLTDNQKKASIAFLYQIGQSAGFTFNQICNLKTFCLEVQIKRVNVSDCTSMLEDKGMDSIIEILNTMDESHKDMLLFSGLGLINDMGPDENVQESFLKSFASIGYTKEMIKEKTEKLMLLEQMLK